MSLRVGVMGCADIAKRAMIPGVLVCAATELVAVSSRCRGKGDTFALEFGCENAGGYADLLKRDDVDVVYMPLPTGLHEEWVTRALDAGKHVLVEKSFTMDFRSARQMVDLARARNLLIVENFQFQTHSQWRWIMDTVASGELGDVHLVRSTFGFPPLPKDNFRWDKELGGGALLDAGAYMVKVAQLLLGEDLQVVGASITHDLGMDVDRYGEIMFRNAAGQVAQAAYGFGYYYQCLVELLGTRGKLTTNRVFTAPPGYRPTMIIEKQDECHELVLSADNHFVNMWQWFVDTVEAGVYAPHWDSLLRQAYLIEETRNAAEFTMR